MNKSLESIVDELAHYESELLQEAIEETGRIAVVGSPVDTGRFKGNWDVMIDGNGYETQPNTYDLGGARTIQSIETEIDIYDILQHETATLYNDVSDLYNNYYASTVKYDFTENTANELVETAMITMDQILSRD